MNLTKVRLSTNVATVDLPLVGAKPTDEYICEQIDGIGPPEVDVFMRDTASGERNHYGRRPQGREIVIRMSLTPNYAIGKTAGDLRKHIYGLFSAGESQDTDVLTVTLYEGDTIWGSTVGYLRRCEIVPFSKDPQVQLVITCSNPYFKGNAVPVNLGALGKNEFTIDNPGSAPSGFYMRIKFTSNRTGFWIRQSSFTKRLEVINPFATNDELRIDTRPGQLSIIRYRAGAALPIFSSMKLDSIWPKLNGGVNSFITAGSNFEWIEFTFDQNHWGV
jgi:hypothetical protein